MILPHFSEAASYLERPQVFTSRMARQTNGAITHAKATLKFQPITCSSEQAARIVNVRASGLLSQTMEEEEEEQPESMDVDSPVSLKGELPYEPLSIEVNDKYFTFLI